MNPPCPRPAPAFDPKDLRRHILRMAFHGQSVHVACAFSLVEICSVLYSRFLRFDPGSAVSPDRDFLILSKGHGVMALYACFREIGWLTDGDLDTYFRNGTHLRGLCEADVPGCEVTSGSLGHGLPIATGIAFGLRRLRSDRRVFCIVGDGEMDEGPMWEAMLFAVHQKLDNLTLIVDANRYQAMGRTEDVLGLEPLPAKFEAFGFAAKECDGHDPGALTRCLSDLLRNGSRPGALVARTTKGHGVSFMADDNRWHYTRLTEDDYIRAVQELS
jgi:transketolase